MAVLVLAASACGGSSKSETTTTSAATAMASWASSVCTSFSAWKASLQRQKENLSNEPTQTEFQNASHQAVLATQGLQSSLQQIGKPPTGTSATVEQQLTSLKNDLLNGKKKIENTLNANYSSPSQVKSGVASVKATATDMLNSFSSTINSLKSLDPSSDISKAFHQTSACDPFFK